jgi:hypothetical protein
MRGTMRATCPGCGGELVATRTGAVCFASALGKCDHSRVMAIAVVRHANQHTYDEQFPDAVYSAKKRVWVCQRRHYRRDTKRRVVDAWCDGATIGRNERGRLMVLVPAKRRSK